MLRSFSLGYCLFTWGCANDVVLGEHITNTPALTTTQASSTSDSTQNSASSRTDEQTVPCFAFTDGGRPPPNKDDHRDDLDDWPFGDGGPYDDCKFPDGGWMPPLPPNSGDHDDDDPPGIPTDDDPPGIPTDDDPPDDDNPPGIPTEFESFTNVETSSAG